MRAMTLRRYGDPEVLQPEDLPVPQPLAGEVRVKVHAVGINPVDYKRRQGGPYTDFPVVLGWDISGVVDALGEGVTDFQPGDEVYGMIRFPEEGRAYAEYVTAPTPHLARKPPALSHVEAAATTLAPLTAWQAFEHMDLKAGQTVLIHAGAGGVGHFAVQLAHARGARGRSGRWPPSPGPSLAHHHAPSACGRRGGPATGWGRRADTQPTAHRGEHPTTQ